MIYVQFFNKNRLGMFSDMSEHPPPHAMLIAHSNSILLETLDVKHIPYGFLKKRTHLWDSSWLALLTSMTMT